MLGLKKTTRSLICYNKLTSLDVSNNAALIGLECQNNSLSSLYVSKNTDLGGLYCGSNKLISLDISKNNKIEILKISEMPSLYKVCIWEMPFPASIVSLDTTNSPNVYFTTDCAGRK